MNVPVFAESPHQKQCKLKRELCGRLSEDKNYDGKRLPEPDEGETISNFPAK
jgi:hypothetical protein